TYQGQWYRGTRHGYGVRQSVPYGLASHYRPKAMRASLTSLRSENEDELVVKSRDKKLDESRGGFVLKAKSDETPPTRRRSIFDKQGRSSLRKTLMSGLKLKKQKSTGDINDSPKRQTGSVRSTISNISHVSADSSQSGVTTASVYTDSNLSFVSQDDITDVNVVETYMGEWKNDKRSGFGISERSDGLKYEGEWYNNRKYGYGVTTFKDGTREEGKYKNNVLISSGKKNKLFLIRTSKLRERVDNAVLSAQRAGQIALQKADIAIT
ncbi:junctophilin-3, partial [Biomphalaria glabrata]